ncbi:O-antigen ligase family protein [Shewanella algae]|uniref:O-antigen ligase family protein n=1 Tax=Shewanella algae TaxID=38313 RepID=UPI00265B6FF2|nr:O-antigen ligase family protein [Shewanella algae]WKC43254.1 O-antigen ligase family protein [Shewanella algae]
MDKFSIFYLPQPEFIRYKLWLASINFFDFIIVVLFLTLLVLKPVKTLTIIVRLEVVVVVVATILGIFFGVLNDVDFSIYFDGVIYTFRFVLVYIVGAYLIRDNEYFVRECEFVFILSAVILVSGSLLAWFLGYQGIMGGRINALGMGPHVTAIFYIFVMFIVFSKLKRTRLDEAQISKVKIAFYYLFLAVLSFGILLTGSRRALLYLAFTYLFLYFYVVKSVSLKLMVMLFFLCFLVIVSLYIKDILFFLSQNGISIAGRVLEMLDGNESVGEDGRFGMWWQVSKLFEQYPYGVGLSDWFIQKTMGKYGWDSHTHNLLLQFYFKYGVSSILFSYFLVSIVVGLKKRIIYSIPLSLMFVDSMGGYIFWNQKAIYIVCLFFVFLFYFNRRDVFNENCTSMAYAKF